MDKFTALQVRRGDAFLLQRQDKNILVDGGQYGDVVPLLAKEKVEKLGICVVTHADADHAGGIVKLLQSSIEVSELWLPAAWQNVVDLFVPNPGQFLQKLSSEVSESGQRDLSLEKYADFVELPTESKYEKPDVKAGDPEILEGIDNSLQGRCLNSKCFLNPGRLFCDSVRTTGLILKIYSAARAKSSCKIRWFLYSRNSSGDGQVGLLQSLNSTEITGRYMPSRFPLISLALSVANKRSLVFYSPEADAQNMVVFTADSDMKSVDLSKIKAVSRETVFTAPHHGSAANKAVYLMFPAIKTIWVRSDCFAKRNPCAEYLGRRPNHYCTRCNTRPPAQNVVLDLSAQKWTRQSRLCSCK